VSGQACFDDTHIYVCILRADPSSAKSIHDEEHQGPPQTPQPESQVTPDLISDHISRLAQIRSAVEALPPLQPPSKRRRLGLAPHLYEGVAELHSIPGVPIGFQALAQLNLTSSIPSVPLGVQAVADLRARANALDPLLHQHPQRQPPPTERQLRPVCLFSFCLVFFFLGCQLSYSYAMQRPPVHKPVSVSIFLILLS